MEESGAAVCFIYGLALLGSLGSWLSRRLSQKRRWVWAGLCALLDFASAARPAAEPSEERREGSGKQQPDQRAGNVDAHIPERRASSKGKALMELIQRRIKKAEAPRAEAGTGNAPEPQREIQRCRKDSVFRHMRQLAHEGVVDFRGGSQFCAGKPQ